MKHEYEVKFSKIDKEKIREQLTKKGFTCKKNEFSSKRKTFHLPHSNKNEWFRVRSEQGKTTMTYKCIHDNTISGMEEIEVSIDNFDAASEMLKKTGLRNTSSQENLREIWIRGAIEVCIDTWPGLQPFIEIEGENEKAVREVATEFGFDWNSGLFGGSEVVYEAELGIPKEIFIKLASVSFINPPQIWSSGT